MAGPLNALQLTGREATHLVELPCGNRLQAEAAAAFARLQADAREAGFALCIASSFRSYQRQRAIWEGKAGGTRPVYDDAGRQVKMAGLPAAEQLRAILRYSAIPGTSRHHWGTDLDVYDAAAMPPGYQLQLSPQEVAPGALFDALHCWLDERMAANRSHGFYRPYGRDRGGVAPERWHLSFAPLALDCAGRLTPELMRACWQCAPGEEPLALVDEIEADLPAIVARYIAVPPQWCPAGLARP
ncbi:MAG: M15 family metallopeptidase [Pseudomonadales bacterium]|nr:M15 family metallopeptidase [Halieaceae bacterium]MCP5190422.1 M15 family metallopeptidase [Pseudomonadales bacterium]